MARAKIGSTTMKYYKNNLNEIYAYGDNETPIQEGLTLVDEVELNELLALKIDQKAQELSELEAEIKEIETHIRHAMLIDNTQVLPDLREEYKELLKRKEELTNEN